MWSDGWLKRKRHIINNYWNSSFARALYGFNQKASYADKMHTELTEQTLSFSYINEHKVGSLFGTKLWSRVCSLSAWPELSRHHKTFASDIHKRKNIEQSDWRRQGMRKEIGRNASDVVPFLLRRIQLFPFLLVLVLSNILLYFFPCLFVLFWKGKSPSFLVRRFCSMSFKSAINICWSAHQPVGACQR